MLRLMSNVVNIRDAGYRMQDAGSFDFGDSNIEMFFQTPEVFASGI